MGLKQNKSEKKKPNDEENKKEIIKNNEEIITEKKEELQNKNDKYNKQKNINIKLYKTISLDLFKKNVYNNRASIFISCKDNNIYIVYGLTTLDLECYDVLNNNKFIIIKKLHNRPFDSCRYYYDEINSRDLIITSSFVDVKVVNFQKENSKVLLSLNFELEGMIIINTAYFILDKILVPISSHESGKIKVYDMNSNFSGEIKDEVGFVLALNKFYWKKRTKDIILISGIKGVTTFIFEDLSLYKKFIPISIKQKSINPFCESHIFEKNNQLILIGASFYYGDIYFWNFENGELNCKISIGNEISDMCIINNRFIVACFGFIFINGNNNKIEEIFERKDKDRICGIKVLRHDSKAIFLISVFLSGKLNLYKIENCNY